MMLWLSPIFHRNISSGLSSSIAIEARSVVTRYGSATCFHLECSIGGYSFEHVTLSSVGELRLRSVASFMPPPNAMLFHQWYLYWSSLRASYGGGGQCHVTTMRMFISCILMFHNYTCWSPLAQCVLVWDFLLWYVIVVLTTPSNNIISRNMYTKSLIKPETKCKKVNIVL